MWQHLMYYNFITKAFTMDCSAPNLIYSIHFSHVRNVTIEVYCGDVFKPDLLGFHSS